MMPPAMTEAICPETLTPMECINRKLELSSSRPILCTTRADIGKAEIPAAPIMGCTPSDRVCRQLNLMWGVTPLYLGMKHETFSLLGSAADLLLEKGLVQEGDITVITAGVPIGHVGTTNMVKVQVIGEPS